MKYLIKKLLRENVDKPKFRYEVEHLSSYGEQHNYELGFYLGEEILGITQYTLFEGELTVSNIFIRPEFRRKGYASRMMQYIKQDNPEYQYKPSMKTDLGAKFKHKDIQGDLNSVDEGLITEKSIGEISSSDFNVEGIGENWLSSSPSTVVGNFKYEMQDDYYLSPEEKEELMDEDDIIETERFKKWLLYEVESKIDDAIYDIKHKITPDGYIRLWRVMTVDDDWLDRLPHTGNRLGVFWSFEKDAAEAHWGGKESNVVRIESAIGEKYINWEQTIESNIDPNLGEEEKEITLFKNTPLKILALEVNDKKVDLGDIINKTYKA
jgi:GNAT superfamily N-acetyltransferase